MKNNVKITEYKVASKKLPAAFDGFRIAHISDAHARPAEGILEAVKSAAPDICVITGDMLHGIKKPTDSFEGFLEKLLEIVPVYMVTGNHDCEDASLERVFERCKKMGAVMLENSFCVLKKNEEEIAISGICDPYYKRRKPMLENLKKSLKDLKRFSGFEVLLFHRANLLDEIKNEGFDLILSGHMHGGQVRLFGKYGVLAPSSCLPGGYRMIFPKYCYGRFNLGNSVAIVNAGMSNTLPIPRWGNEVEVGVVRLCHF